MSKNVALILCELFKSFCIKLYMENVPRELLKDPIGSMKMGYVSDTNWTRTRNLFRLERARRVLQLGHCDGQIAVV